MVRSMLRGVSLVSPMAVLPVVRRAFVTVGAGRGVDDWQVPGLRKVGLLRHPVPVPLQRGARAATVRPVHVCAPFSLHKHTDRQTDRQTDRHTDSVVSVECSVSGPCMHTRHTSNIVQCMCSYVWACGCVTVRVYVHVCALVVYVLLGEKEV